MTFLISNIVFTLLITKIYIPRSLLTKLTLFINSFIILRDYNLFDNNLFDNNLFDYNLFDNNLFDNNLFDKKHK